jgi:hypothetical protein
MLETMSKVLSKEEIADLIAHNAFQGLGLEMNADSLKHSFLATAWSMGMPAPSDGWAGVDVRYHYEEVLALRFLAIEAEFLVGYLTKLMKLTEAELAIPVQASGLTPLDVLRSMTRWSRAHARHRASIVGSHGEISIEEALAIYNSRVLRYESLVAASVTNKGPIPIRSFQLGLSREHPWMALVCNMSDNMCDSLGIEREGMAAMPLQLAIDSKRRAFYESVLKNLR